MVEALHKTYSTGGKEVQALRGVSLGIGKGEVFGLLGPNGAGKTTLVKILATLLRASGGRAEVGGYDVGREADKVRRIIGYAGQDSERSAYFRLTVRENLLYFAHALRDVPVSSARERIERISSSIGFEDRLDKHFISLSGGEKQLVVVMRAIIHEPEVCFLDEPSKSLDPLTARRVRDFLKSYAREKGMTICLTTHNMREAEEFCDRIGFINHGQLRFTGTPADFKRSVTVKEVLEISSPMLDGAVEERLRSIPGVSNSASSESTVRLYCDDASKVLNEVLAVLNDFGIKAHLSMIEPSLEDAFAVFVGNDAGG
ncbi:MAG: ABC transporter ATP-binding protein [Candidatus Brockarchaeota archaeon]|nr:ABC transporter ATP-binding protein [Candidatus Brockarchaeota archaeon]